MKYPVSYLGVHGDLRGHECRHRHELQVGVSDQLPGKAASDKKASRAKIARRRDHSSKSKEPGQPEERLLEVVVGLGGDVVVLEVLLPVEDDGLGLHLAVLDVHLVAGQHDRDVLADPKH